MIQKPIDIQFPGHKKDQDPFIHPDHLDPFIFKELEFTPSSLQIFDGILHLLVQNKLQMLQHQVFASKTIILLFTFML
ncbi:hypothetical protein ACJX0J_034049 [Zea mays]